MALETRNRTTPAGNPIKEKYVECVGCGEWRWIQFMSQAMQCSACKQTVSLGKRAVTLTRDFTSGEKALIKAFMLTNGVSKECATESHEYEGKPLNYGVSNCSPGIKL